MEPLTLYEFIAKNAIIVGIFIAMIILFLYSEIQNRGRRFADVRPTEAVNLINRENAVVVDVRSQKEFAEGHILNAINVPIENFATEAKKLAKYKEKHVITYCRSGMSSQRACKELEKEGFTHIHNLRGGIVAWERDNLPLDRHKS